MHDLIILGVLQEAELHGYELKQRADRLMAGFYEVSYGSLYPNFKKLEGAGLIKSKSTFTEGGQEKISYQITDKGIKEFVVRMENVPKESFQMSWVRFQIKVLFFNYLEPSVRTRLSDHMISLAQQELDKLNAALETAKATPFKETLLKKNHTFLTDSLKWIESLKKING